MSIEKKAKAYDEALDRAKAYKGHDDIRRVLEVVFPELKESEGDGEKIRNFLIDFIKVCCWTEKEDQGWPLREECIAWLEKQSEFSENNKDEADTICKQNESTDSCDSLNIKKKFPADEQRDFDEPDVKVEPKFREGEWLCANKSNDYARLVKIIKLVDVFKKKRYKVLRDYDSDLDVAECDFIEKNYHPWTIEDARDGDVLATDSGVCIFDGTLEEGKYLFAYCGITERGFESYNRNLPFSHDNNIHPATKEQRDTLMKAMTDAGYTFDFEKNELKKIEPKFHEGDWIAYKEIYIAKILSVNANIYKIEFTDGNKCSSHIDYVDRYFHLWSIKDASDGDVLEFGDHGRLVVGIVSCVNKITGKVDVNCLLENNNFKVGNYYNLDTIKPHPATKEQRDILFKKMKEAGYTFDFEKNELKKIETKFHEGDFIADTYCRGKVVMLTDDAYLLDTGQSIPFSCEDNVHLWTIEDAKDGDVFCTDNGNLFIFKEKKEDVIYDYCGFYNGMFFVHSGSPNGIMTRSSYDGYKPATKEQYDFLFLKMKEAGYEWDSGKKELKKIETNPANKVEPKFREGDWIISHYNHVAYIKSIDEKNYSLSFIDGNSGKLSIDCINRNWRLWTIKDARKGDVLVHGGCVFIFICIENGIVQAIEENLCNGTKTCNFGNPDEYDDNDYHPATKEERDALFVKIKEAGYAWNAEQKKLEKIEQKIDEQSENKRLYTMNVYYPNCCLEFEEGIEQGIACCKTENKPILIDLNGIYLRITPSSTTENVINEYNKCARGKNIFIKEKTNITNQWNSNDESWLKGVITDIECEVLCANCSREIADMKINWLKSLKDRIQPQVEWSAEDEKILSDAEMWLYTLCGYLKDSSSEYIPNVGVIISKLKSLKSRIPPKQEWSEEDSMHLANAILAAEKEWGTESCTSKWLKSLRPQNQWKPTEDQINALEWQVNHTSDGLWQHKATKELLEQIKQL